MQIFNIERKKDKINCICYIQVKDIELLKKLGIKLNSYDKMGDLLVTRVRAIGKCFVRIEDTEDVATIRTNSSIIIDYERIVNGSEKSLNSLYMNLKLKRKKLAAEMKEFVKSLPAVANKDYLRNNPEYRSFILKNSIIDNQIVDTYDIYDVRYGSESILVPEAISFNGLIASNDSIELFKGLNPNDYFVVQKNDKKYSASIKDEVSNYKDSDTFNTDLVSEFVTSHIKKDLEQRYGDDDSYSFIVNYKLSEDFKALIIKIRVKPILKNKARTKTQ